MPVSARGVQVVHLLSAGDIGGAARFLVDLASRPEETGADHAIAILTPNPRLTQLFRDAGLRVHDGGPVREDPVAYLRHALGPRAVAFYASVLSEERAAVAHLHTFGSHVAGTRAARKLGVKVMRTEHGISHYEDWSCAPFTRWALNYTDRVVCVSQWVRDSIAQRVPRLNVPLSVVHNGIDLRRFPVRPFPEGRPIRFVIACRLEPLKQVRLAIEALQLLPDALLDIAGDGTERPLLEALARARGVASRVRFLGFQADVASALAAGHVAVSCARDEGLGLSVMEAMAVGRPVIATRVGGVPEVLRDGQEGFLVEPSVASLAAAMRQAAGDPERLKLLGRTARARIESAFTVEQMCFGYRSEYQAVLDIDTLIASKRAGLTGSPDGGDARQEEEGVGPLRLGFLGARALQAVRARMAPSLPIAFGRESELDFLPLPFGGKSHADAPVYGGAVGSVSASALAARRCRC